VTPSVKQDIFNTLQDGIDAINSFADNPAGRASFQNLLTNLQESLDNGMQNVDLTRGKIGGRLNAIDSEINTNLSLIITSKESLSDVRDLDVVEAATRFSQQLTVLEAAQASFVRIQNLNLFNFL
jgi:flagellar hook-associated protein 3 FlgL